MKRYHQLETAGDRKKPIAYNPHNEAVIEVKFSSAYLTIGAGGDNCKCVVYSASKTTYL